MERVFGKGDDSIPGLRAIMHDDFGSATPLTSYYVIINSMSQVFEGKVRRLGNSMAVIIPKEVLEDAGVKEGDLVKLSIPIPNSKRTDALKKMAGIDSHAEPFLREKRDRF
jgi:hypothetical protein